MTGKRDDALLMIHTSTIEYTHTALFIYYLEIKFWHSVKRIITNTNIVNTLYRTVRGFYYVAFTSI